MIDKIVLFLKWAFQTGYRLVFLIYVFACLVVGGEELLTELLVKYTGGARNATEFAFVLALIIAPLSLFGFVDFIEKSNKEKDDK